jgi:murein DD-endopeptidase MepM/ murein hydrolase activator NlpD
MGAIRRRGVVREKRRRGGGRLLAFLAGVTVLLLVGTLTFRTGESATLTLETDRPGIGPSTRVTLLAQAGGRGLGTLRLELVQGPRGTLLAERAHEPRPVWAVWGARTEEDRLEVALSGDSLAGLVEGTATLRASAARASTWLLAPDPVVVEQSLPVRLTPPSLAVLSRQNYVAQGGSAVVVYQAGSSSVLDGVRVRDWWFPGFPLPERGPGARFALFGVPHDLEEGDTVELVAEDELGNQARNAFVDSYIGTSIREATLPISDSFMAKVVPEILAHTPQLAERGSLLESYLMINGELRRANAASLEQLAETSTPRFLWSRSFLPLRGGKVMSSFGDRRTYTYQGQPVDRQDHLGYDLASTRQAPVQASNDGAVALAGYLGIYGNTVVIDHGYGLMTLYAHLSSMSVTAGQQVVRGQEIGRTGESGLAGGDHLHFSVLIAGHPVNPLEWWDARWIRDRVAPKLGGVLSFEG